MNYITACPACATQFLISTEHLKAYRGKVQCGHCDHVFNAKNRLTEVSDETQNVEEYNPAENEVTENVTENDAVESVSTEDHIDSTDLNFNETEPNPSDSNPSELNTSGFDQPELNRNSIEDHTNTEIIVDSETEADTIFMHDGGIGSSSNESSNSTFIHHVDGEPTIDSSNFVLDSEPLADTTQAETNVESSDSLRKPDQKPNFTAPIVALEDEVNIKSIRAPILIEDLTADPKFQLTRPKPRYWLIVIIGFLLAAAILQSMFFLRSTIAADYPRFKPYFLQACQYLGCKIYLPQQLTLLSIDDSDMQESDVYKEVIDFTSAIVNNADHVQAYPNIELTLTDAQDKPVLRKLVKPQEYLQTPTNVAKGIGAHAEERIRLAINVHALSVAGYRVLLTY